MVSCIDRNGEITGYLVRYGVLGQSTQTMPVSGGDTTMTTISSVMSPITYSIEVAAVNSVDTGPYSDPITVETPRSKWGWNSGNIIVVDHNTTVAAGRSPNRCTLLYYCTLLLHHVLLTTQFSILSLYSHSFLPVAICCFSYIQN